MSTIQTHTFNNGFRVIYEKHYNGMNLSDIRVYVRFGSSHEPPNLRGIAHLIEHMCFKGTTNLPTSKQITTIFDEMGAYLNATTEHRFTYYSVYTHRKNTEKSLQTLGDMLLSSVFDKAELAKEINVVIEENASDAADYQRVMEETMYSMVFEGTPYAYPVDTMKYHVGKMKSNLENRDAVYDIYKTHYVPHNMVVSIVSSLSFRSIVNMLSQTLFVKNPKFATCRCPTLHVKPPPYFVPLKHFDMRITRIPKLNVAYICVSFVVCSEYIKPDVRILRMLSTLLSGSFMSRLFYIFREKYGLTYASSSNALFFDSIGAFSILLTSDSARLITHGREKGVLSVLVDLLNDLVKNGVTAKELEHAVKYLEGKLNINSEQSDHQCAYNAEMLLLHNKETPTPYNQLFKKIRGKYTLKDMNAVIKKYFTPERMRVCIVGGNLPSDRDIEDVFSEFSA